MTIPPIHNCIVQWTNDPDLEDGIYLNIFVTDSDPYYYSLTSKYMPDTEVNIATKTYENYITNVLDIYNPPYLYIPTTATTAKEARTLHPELFI